MSSSSIGFNIKNITTQEFFDFHYKESCTLATTGSLTLASDFNTGDTLDSVTLVLGDRILIKDQADASENGIYTVNNSGAPTRAVDFDNPSEVTKGAYVSVVHGSTNNNTSYVMSTNAVPTVIDTTQLTFTNISSATIADEAVTLAKMAHAAANTVLVRDANSTGDPSFKAVTDTQILIGNGTGFTAAALSGDATMTNGGAVTIAAEAVTLAKMAHAAANTVLVRDANSTGDPSFKAVTDTQILIGNGTGFTAAALSGDATMTNGGAVSLAGAQTNITSIYNSALKVGRDTHNQFDFATDNVIKVSINAVDDEFRFSAGGAFHADGDITSFSSTTSSDKRLKKNIKTIEYGLEDVLQLRGVEFDWKEKRDGKHDIGFIAQEVQEIIPEVINEIPNKDNDEDKYLGVDYSKIVPLLVESIKEQQIQIDSLKNEIELLKNK